MIGFTNQIVKDGRQVRLYSWWTKRLALLGEALASLRCEFAAIDGDLGLIRLRSQHHDGKDIMPMPLLEPALKLAELVARSDVRWVVSQFEILESRIMASIASSSSS